MDDFWEEIWKLRQVNRSVNSDLFLKVYGVAFDNANNKFMITDYIPGQSLETFVKYKLENSMARRFTLLEM